MYRFNKDNIEVFLQWNEKDFTEFDELDYWNMVVVLGNCSLFTGERDGFSTPQNYLFR